MPKTAAVLLIAVASTALVAAGCGGDDEETTTSTSTTSTTAATGATGAAGPESAVATEVNEICKDTNKEIDSAFESAFSAGGEPSSQDLQKAADAVVPVINDVLDQMRAVDGAEDDPGVSNFIDTAQEDVDALEDDPASLGPESFAAADKAADEAGLTACVG